MPADQTWALLAIMLIGVAISIWCEQKYAWAAKISGPVLGLLIAMVLTSAGAMPTATEAVPVPAYAFVDDYLVPLAIPLLLFRADVARIVKTAGKTFIAFHVSVLGTVVGAVLAGVLLWDQLGPDRAGMVGMMTGSYSGGGVNFMMLESSLEVAESTSASLIVADNFIMAGMFLALLVLAGSRFLLRHYPHPHSADDSVSARDVAAEHWKAKPVGLRDIATAVAIATTVVALGYFLKDTANGWFGEVAPKDRSTLQVFVTNEFVWFTALSVTLATAGRRFMTKIHGAEDLGSYLLYVFLFGIGLKANLVTVFRDAPIMLVFCGIIAVVNLAVTLALGKLLRLNLEDLLMCVNATLGGAPSAAAMAIARGWSGLILPGLLVGIWGYVIGTAIGLLIGENIGTWI